METVEEKIRNKVTPFWNLSCLCKEDMSKIDMDKMFEVFKQNCEYLIKIGNIVDRYLPDGFDINKKLENE